MQVGVEVVAAEEAAEHCDGQDGQHQQAAETLALKRWRFLNEWRHPSPEEGRRPVLWRRMQSRMTEEETCC